MYSTIILFKYAEELSFSWKLIIVLRYVEVYYMVILTVKLLQVEVNNMSILTI